MRDNLDIEAAAYAKEDDHLEGAMVIVYVAFALLFAIFAGGLLLVLAR